MAQGYPAPPRPDRLAAVEAMARRSLSLIARDIDPRRRVSDLTRTEKSLVAIARALGVDARVLVLDEPTASLPQDEVASSSRVLRGLKAQWRQHDLRLAPPGRGLRDLRRPGRAARRPGGRRRPHRRRDAGGPDRADHRPSARELFVRPAPPGHEPVLVCADLRSGDVGPALLPRQPRRDDRPRRPARRRSGDGRPGADRGRAAAMAALSPSAASSRDRELAGRRHRRRHRLRRRRPHRRVGRARHVDPREHVPQSARLGPRPLRLALGRRRRSRRPRRSGAASACRPTRPEAPIETLSGGNQQKVVHRPLAADRRPRC